APSRACRGAAASARSMLSAGVVCASALVETASALTTIRTMRFIRVISSTEFEQGPLLTITIYDRRHAAEGNFFKRPPRLIGLRIKDVSRPRPDQSGMLAEREPTPLR